MQRTVFSRAEAIRSFVIDGPVTTTLGLVGVAVLWQVTSNVVDAPWLPSFTEALARVGELIESGTLGPILASSITNLLVGYAIAVVLGVSLGSAMALSRKAHYAFRWLVHALLFVPPVLYAPLVLAFLGFSDASLIGVIVSFSAFVITVNTETAIKEVESELREMAFSFGANRRQLLREVILAGAMPQIFAGLRLGMARAVKGMIVGELFVTVVGLGALERRYTSSFDAVGVWAIALVVIGLAVLCLWTVQFIDRVINWWAT